MITHSLSLLLISLWHMFFPRSDTALHNNVKKKEKKSLTHAFKHANCAVMRGRRSRLKIAQSLQPSLQAPDRLSSHLAADESSRRCSRELLSPTLTSSQSLLTAAKKYLLSCLIRVPFFSPPLFFLIDGVDTTRDTCVLKQQNLYSALLFFSFLPPLLHLLPMASGSC